MHNFVLHLFRYETVTEVDYFGSCFPCLSVNGSQLIENERTDLDLRVIKTEISLVKFIFIFKESFKKCNIEIFYSFLVKMPSSNIRCHSEPFGYSNCSIASGFNSVLYPGAYSNIINRKPISNFDKLHQYRIALPSKLRSEHLSQRPD